MAPTTRSQLRPQQRRKEPEKPSRRVSGDRFKSSRSRCLWERRKKEFSTDPVFQLGEYFARTVDPFVGLAQMVQMESKEARNKDRREHQSYTTLVRLLSLQGEDLVGSTPTLSKGQSKAWSADFKVSQAMLSQRLGNIDSVQSFDDRSLLCPPTCDRNDEGSVIQGKFLHYFTCYILRMKWALCSEPYTVNAGCWPNVLYQNREIDAQDPWKGFLRSGLLVMIYKHIFRLQVTASSRLPGIDLHATPASIAYIATLVIAALDVQDTNTRKRARQTFTVLSHHLYEHQDSGARELSRWWDRQLQGLEHPKPSFSNGRPTSGVSILDRLAHKYPAIGNQTQLDIIT
ncbi:hypothetical protein BKA70DRAFT_1450455 [Coprinopsis sp. MPI-PUGE-AT-0042]|nr:hypothetical protein BKA70DRAFT_1450455 [Coprinopsis sp. MPI-PUGE-AT-0042]